VISAIELAFLLSGTDSDQQAEAIDGLIQTGDPTFVIESGAIIGLDITAQRPSTP
jgi:hypothetical protein